MHALVSKPKNWHKWLVFFTLCSTGRSTAQLSPRWYDIRCISTSCRCICIPTQHLLKSHSALSSLHIKQPNNSWTGLHKNWHRGKFNKKSHVI